MATMPMSLLFLVHVHQHTHDTVLSGHVKDREWKEENL